MSHEALDNPLKFIKGLRTPRTEEITATQSLRFFMKLLYEFWGFCVNGTDDLIVPGGFAISGTRILPNGFTTGSAILLGSGGDGSTTFATDEFRSSEVNFETLHLTAMSSSSGIVDKFLVTWKPGSTSTDDSVYRITSIHDANTIRVEPYTGGSTRLGAKAWFETRSAVKFRVVDILSSSQLTAWTSSMGFVMQFDGASSINQSQRAAQAYIQVIQPRVNTFVNLKISVSPSGTWNGTAFTDATGSSEVTWSRTADTQGFGFFHLFGGKECLGAQMSGGDGAWIPTPVGFHFEVPKRTLPAQQDPNPVTWMMWNSGSLPNQLAAYASGFQMLSRDSVQRSMTTLIRSPFGDVNHTAITPTSGGLWADFELGDRFGMMSFNEYEQKYMSTDALLHQPASGSYCLARCRLRRVRFTSNNTPVATRFGERWVHVGNGVLWPWDNGDQPFGLFTEGGP